MSLTDKVVGIRVGCTNDRKAMVVEVGNAGGGPLPDVAVRWVADFPPPESLAAPPADTFLGGHPVRVALPLESAADPPVPLPIELPPGGRLPFVLYPGFVPVMLDSADRAGADGHRVEVLSGGAVVGSVAGRRLAPVLAELARTD